MYYLPIKIPIVRFLANSILFYSYRIILPYLILSDLIYSIQDVCTARQQVPYQQICAIRSETIRNTTGFTQKPSAMTEALFTHVIHVMCEQVNSYTRPHGLSPELHGQEDPLVKNI